MSNISYPFYKIKILNKINFISVFILSLSSFAQSHLMTSKSSSTNPIHFNSVLDIGLTSIEIALNDQIKNPHSVYQKGEFTTQIKSSLIPKMGGVGKIIGFDEEPSAFNTGLVLNVLGEIYFENPELKSTPIFQKIPEAVRLGVSSFKPYQDHDSFNFYPPYITKNGVKVRRPKNLTILPFWKGFTHIPNDADTTSVATTALLLNAKINGTPFEVDHKTIAQLEKFRDLDRKPHYYNKRYHTQNTGAFLTWLYDENDPQMPRFYFAPSEKGARIPFNRNDVDCVVNANALKMLSKSNIKDLNQVQGFNEACQFLDTVIEKNIEFACGVYYPNTHNLSYILSQINKNLFYRNLKSQTKTQCLKETSKTQIIKKILEGQYQDGYWLNEGNLHKDRIMATAFALNTLMTFNQTENLSHFNQDRIRDAATLGVKYLISQMALDSNNNSLWKPGHIFTAGAIVRSLLMWKSKAYTHSIIGEALLKYSKIYSEMTLENIKSYESPYFETLKTEPVEIDKRLDF